MVRIRACAVALAAALLMVLGDPVPSAAAEAIRLAYPTWVGSGPLFLARKKGFFKDEGVKVELVRIEDVTLRFAAMAAGRIDVIVTTVDALPLYLIPEGKRYQYLFALDHSAGRDGVVATKDIKEVADLKGRKVALTKGSAAQFYLNVLLREAGLTQSDIEVVDMSTDDAGSAFVAGRVPAAVTSEPWLTRGQQAPYSHLLTDSSRTPGLITGVVLAPVEVIAEREDEIKALYRAWSRAVEFVGSNRDEALQIMAKGLGGWLKDPASFARTLGGVAYYDAAMNAAYFGTAGQPGDLHRTVQGALDAWSGLGRLQVSVTAGDLISYAALEQAAGEPAPKSD